MNRLLIVQPYVPGYRLPLFRQLKIGLRDIGVEMAIAAGTPKGDLKSRSDDFTHSMAEYQLPELSFSVAAKQMNLRSLKHALQDFQPTMIIVEQAIKNLEIYPLIAKNIFGDTAKLAFWGQGRAYSTHQSSLASAVKQWVTRRSDWFFAYTRSGADYIVSRGFNPQRVTVLDNSIDTNGLRNDIRAVTEFELQEFEKRFNVKRGKTAIFIGGIDERKGISFLIEAAKEIRNEVDDFNLLIGGDGSKVHEVIQLDNEGGPVRYLGRLEGKEKAVALSFADIFLVPQWVGLVALDSLVSGVPMVTTKHYSHSPEFEYLVDGRNAFVTEHNTSAYADQVVSLLDDRDRLADARVQGLLDSERFSVENMVGNFISGIGKWQSQA